MPRYSTRKPPFCYLAPGEHVWSARLLVPADVRHLFPVTVLKKSTGETDVGRAATVAYRLVTEWKETIRQARQGRTALENKQIAKYASDLRGMDQDEAFDYLVTTVMPFMGAKHNRPDYDYLADELVFGRPRDTPAHRDYRILIGEAVPFTAFADVWGAQLVMRKRQRGQYISDVKALGSTLGKDLKSIQPQDVRDWIAQQELKPATVNRKLAIFRNYWSWLQTNKHVSADHAPFADMSVKKERKRDSEKRQDWRPHTLIEIWQAAYQRNYYLHAAIVIAAYSGARREEIAKLRPIDVDLRDTIPHFVVEGEIKTDASDRRVPIHPAILPLMRELVRQNNEHLIQVPWTNRFGERGAAIGRAFADLRDEMQFDGRYVYHSIRKTVATILDNADVPEHHAADVIGHKRHKGRMTYGTYSSKSSLETKYNVIKKIKYPVEGKLPTRP